MYTLPPMPPISTAFLPLQTAIQHMVYVPTVDDDGNPVMDSHGNQRGSYADPVTRMIVCWWPLERRTWEVDPVDPDVVARYEADIHLLVPDPTIYNKPDRVIITNQRDTKITFQVEGLPTDWKSALPFQTAAYGVFIGGEVHCRRVSSTGVLAGQ